MIKAVVYDTVAEVKVSGGGSEFSEDLDRLKADIDRADRRFDDNKRVWVVSNFTHYAHLPYIAAAIREREFQPRLF